MAKTREQFDDFRKVEEKLCTLTMVRDNLSVIAEGLRNMDVDDGCSNAVELDSEVIKTTVDEMKELFRIADKGKLQVTERWYRDFFPIHFDEYVKGSIEEEFADICIRIMDFAYEKYGEDMKWWKWERNGELHESTFTEKAYTLLVWMTDATDTDTLSLLISFVYDWAESLSIDLDWFIEMKMRYNESRPVKHGKAY